MTRPIVRLIGILLLVAAGGCASTEKITTRGDLGSVPPDQPIKVFARNERIYVLHQHALVDTFIRGSGTLSERGRKSAFTGDIPFSEITAVETGSRSTLKGLAVVGLTAVFLSYLLDGTGSQTGLVPTVGTSYVPPPGGGGGGGTSCPYVYVWDGTEYRLEAEPFGVALGKGLELTTRHLLPAARVEDGVVRLRLSNERLETHYVNSVELLRIDLGVAPRAVLDVEGVAWPLTQPVAPITARDRYGRDLLPQVTAVDGQRWEGEVSSMTPGSGYEDVLELSFERPGSERRGSLVLNGINTELSTVIYRRMSEAAGDQQPALAHAIESDPEMIRTLQRYLHDASFEAFVWNGHDWQSVGRFQPEASAVSFTRALRLEIPEDAGDIVRLRLRSMAGVWKVDAIAMDWGARQPLPMTPVPMRSAIGPAGEDLSRDLAAADQHYAVLLPPDRVELTFATGSRPVSERTVYAVAARGHLMEWDSHVIPGAGAPLYAAGEDRVTFLKALLQQRDLALEPVYEEWRKSRAR